MYAVADAGSASELAYIAPSEERKSKHVGGEMFATQKRPAGIVSDVPFLRKSSPEAPKSSPGTSKIDPGGIQDAIF